MTTLYNCKSVSAAEFRITKFDRDYNVTSSYVVSNGGCDCPQGNKPTCRHRKMLPEFAKNGHIDDGFFLDFDTRQWRKPLAHAIAGGDIVEQVAEQLETELSPKAAAVGHASALPQDPPVAPKVELRAAPSGINSTTGGSAFKRRKLSS